MGSLSIKTKLTWLIILTLCIPFTLYGFYWYNKSTIAIENNATQSSIQYVQQLNNHLDYYFADLERITLPVFTHPLIQQLLEVEPEDQYNRFYLHKKIGNEVLPNIRLSRPDISGISIVSEDGRKITSYGTTSNHLYSGKDLKDDNYKIMGISNPEKPVLTIARKLIDTTSYRSTGLLLIDINLNQLLKIISEVHLGESGNTSIVNSNGLILYHHDKNKIGKNISKEELKNFLSQPTGSLVKKGTKSENIITYSHSPLTDLITIAEVPKKELIIDLINLRNTAVASILFITIFALIIIGSFSIKIIKSLANLQTKMKQAEIGDLTVRINEGKQDEIGKLNRSFNKMVEEMERLIEVVHKSELREKEVLLKQREAVLQAMQFQVNPHFLYNTLEIINSHAIVNGEMTISRMSTALADIFRYAVQGNTYRVSLDKEIENSKNFIEIQQERYRYLKVEWLFDETPTSKVSAIRLIMQPIIENAFEHGYESKRIKPNYLKITGESCEHYYLLEIVDKGEGMTSSRLNKYNCAFDISDLEQMNQVNQEMLSNGIGLWNVHFRIRLAFGAPYGIYIKRSDIAGTTIQIKLPYDSPDLQ
ncbi:sensor histidine kinase [Lederbergia lenta]|uniref:Two-component sensor histidine kinase n=1 Tax=Lederbergia lenta TaxID=1467 RepID=A0A2X4WEK7_LEDLE|nr:sensor histidine kinase [Lederbergia lenta]MCM3112135.1 histidine kinase [Lederbergia lenta]MEC2323306.1 cache domain-containing protein [Lederbergia lenta]SQI63167.1 two-component sensor histidine kinase [Lederbergia lenta]